jgi:hypothetical protein
MFTKNISKEKKKFFGFDIVCIQHAMPRPQIKFLLSFYVCGMLFCNNKKASLILNYN